MGPKTPSIEVLQNQGQILLHQVYIIRDRIKFCVDIKKDGYALLRAIQDDVKSIIGERSQNLLDSLCYTADFDTVKELHKTISEDCLQLSVEYYDFLDKIEEPTIKTELDGTLSAGNLEKDGEIEELELFQLLLPTVPIFNGDILKFASFRASFDRAVNDLNIPAQVKMSALKTLIPGRAGKFLERYGTTEADYASAYSELKKKYTNPRRVAEAVLNSFNSIAPCKDAVKTEELERFRNEMSASYNALKNLRIEHLAEFILFSSIKSRIPLKLQKKLQEELGDTNIPDVSAVLTFLDSILRVRVSKRTSMTTKKYAEPTDETPYSYPRKSASFESGTAKKRGRPAPDKKEKKEDGESPAKRGRGRPKGSGKKGKGKAKAKASTGTSSGRGRGRPKKEEKKAESNEDEEEEEEEEEGDDN